MTTNIQENTAASASTAANAAAPKKDEKTELLATEADKQRINAELELEYFQTMNLKDLKKMAVEQQQEYLQFQKANPTLTKSQLREAWRKSTLRIQSEDQAEKDQNDQDNDVDGENTDEKREEESDTEQSGADEKQDEAQKPHKMQRRKKSESHDLICSTLCVDLKISFLGLMGLAIVVAALSLLVRASILNIDFK